MINKLTKIVETNAAYAYRPRLMRLWHCMVSMQRTPTEKIITRALSIEPLYEIF